MLVSSESRGLRVVSGRFTAFFCTRCYKSCHTIARLNRRRSSLRARRAVPRYDRRAGFSKTARALQEAQFVNPALGREYVAQTPFRRGTLALIKFERENNRRIRRVTADQEA